MENRNKPVTATLTEADVKSLIGSTGVRPDRVSPLARISGAGTADIAKLQRAGLLEGGNRTTPDCAQSFGILANPETEIDMIWGTADRMSLANLFSAGADARMVSFTKLNTGYNIAYFVTPQDISDLIIKKTAIGDIKEPASLSLEVSYSALPVFFAVLDLYHEAQLKAALERRGETESVVTAEDINRVIQNAKMDSNFGWYASAGYVSMTGSPVTIASINEGINALKSVGMIGTNGLLTTALTSFAAGAFPLISFNGINVLKNNGSNPEKTEMALFRGFSSLLFIQMTPNSVMINSISTSQVPEILFNLATRPFEPPEITPPTPPSQPAAGTACAKCGTGNIPGAKFCIKCGAPMTAAAPKPSFCPKCGDPVKPGEKFCDKCGAKLA